MSRLASWTATALLLLGAHDARADEPPPGPGEIRSALGRAVPLLARSAETYTQHRDCFSCHHQAMPVVALTTARGRGVRVDEAWLASQVEHTAADLAGALADYRKGHGQGGGVTRAGYALWTLEAGGAGRDETTEAVVSYLLRRDADRGPWRTSSNRPPSEASDFTSTYLALRALDAFGPPAERGRIERRSEMARDWLVGARPKDTEDRVFRLLALKLAGAEEATLRSAAEELKSDQHADGGWAQLPGRDADAYATGSALVALHLAGGLPTTDRAYQRGLLFLLRAQRGDGSWHVASRSKPFQEYFESGFPHGPDQFISAAASSWAVAALALALPETPAVP